MPASRPMTILTPIARKAAPVKKPVAKKAAPARKPAPAKKPVAPKKATPAKKAAPAKVAPKKAPASRPAKTPNKPAAIKKPAARPASKTAAVEPVRPARPVPQRPTGKVAVAVPSRPQQPVARGKHKVVPYKTDEATGRPIVPEGYRPSPDEEYMSALQLEYFRQRLLQWRADLVEESKQTIENLKDEVRDVGDEAERATRETENSLELRTRDRYRKLISKIDSTLKRVDSGDYGFCADTGEEIGLERLEARLTAERTIDAQERWEHLQKQMGD